MLVELVKALLGAVAGEADDATANDQRFAGYGRGPALNGGFEHG